MPLEYDIEALKKLAAEQRAKTFFEQDKPEYTSLAIDLLDEYPAEKHRFHPAAVQRMEQLMESIRLNGMLNPLIVRRQPNERYQIIAGHNRRMAAAKLGWREVPCIVRSFSDDDSAHLAMIADNLDGRQDILPSEKAWSYRDQLEIRKRQGRRTDLTSRQVGEKWSVTQLSEAGNESERQIHRYIRLTYLIPELLQRVDEGRIGIGTAVELSYLSRRSQQIVYEHCYRTEPMRCLKEKQAKRLREIEEDPDNLVDIDALEALFAKKPTQRLRTVKLDLSRLRQYFPKSTSEEIVVQTIHKALQQYFERGDD